MTTEFKHWSEWELARLRKACEENPINFEALQKKLVHRTKAAIYQAMWRYNIQTPRVWGCADDYKLEKLHAKGLSLTEIAKEFPERSYEAVNQRCMLLGLRFYKKWTDREIQEIESMSKFYTTLELAEMYGVTYAMMNSVFQRFRIKRKRSPWRSDKRKLTNEQVLEIRRLARKKEWTIKKLAEKYDSTKGTIYAIIKKVTYKDVK